jgi:Ca2+-binding RTX toxin-like protein
VQLGKGDDSVYLFKVPDLDGRHQFIDGGMGYDAVTIPDGTAALAKLTANVEMLVLPTFQQSVNFSGCHFDTVSIGEPNSLQATQLKHFSVDTRLEFTGATFWDAATLTVQIDGAAASTDEHLDLLFDGAGRAGSVEGGVFLPNLSAAHIEVDNDAFFYLGTIGAADDSAEITITGAHKIWMGTAAGSTSYIDRIEVTQGASVDLSGMTHGNQAFVSSGATIIGGAGDDVLVGGSGADTISTGGGDNTVIGSLGADAVTLVANSGLDVLEFSSQGQSAFGSGHDSIDDFGIFDVIDISAIGTPVTFAGTVANMSAGMTKLSTSHATAFFNAADHTLYVDLDHDQQLLAADDMQLQLNGVGSLQAENLVS